MPPRKSPSHTTKKATTTTTPTDESAHDEEAAEVAPGPSVDDLRASLRLNENFLEAAQHVPVAVAVKAVEEELDAFRLEQAAADAEAADADAETEPETDAETTTAVA